MGWGESWGCSRVESGQQRQGGRGWGECTLADGADPACAAPDMLLVLGEASPVRDRLEYIKGGFHTATSLWRTARS